ncbi:UNVERIFIED_CONTAM: hypothetical protein Slati_3578400 [Sesamum latifolium]|uniref:Uncharacterized protein n=1 Tax=Sesamum latifolium TaxID=2727402 RepID=A0AAW2TZ54_9LAMI
MKALSKPLSSPGRAEKFPPPLMRFLRSNVGSRSRGRSRSSPIFYLRTKKATVPAGVIQEPSSPKVTCIGQVRVRRSAKTKPRKTGGAPPRRRRRCWWLKKTLFCGKIPWRFRWPKRPFKGVFCRWGLCLRWWCCKKVDGTEDSFRGYCNEKSEKSGGGGNDHSESGCSDNKYENVRGGAAEESKRDCVEMESSSSPSSPPKNALLLTRCRSAPYRSSSLGVGFGGLHCLKRMNLKMNQWKCKRIPFPIPIPIPIPAAVRMWWTRR